MVHHSVGESSNRPAAEMRCTTSHACPNGRKSEVSRARCLC